MATTEQRIPCTGQRVVALGGRHEVDLLLHEDLGDPTSTRGDLVKKKGVPLQQML